MKLLVRGILVASLIALVNLGLVLYLLGGQGVKVEPFITIAEVLVLLVPYAYWPITLIGSYGLVLLLTAALMEAEQEADIEGGP